MQGKEKDGGNAAGNKSKCQRCGETDLTKIKGWCLVDGKRWPHHIWVWGAVQEGGNEPLLGKVSDRSDTSDRWMVGDEDCPPVLKLLDEFREEMLRFIPQRFDEQKVILDTKLLKLREMVHGLVSDRSDTSQDPNSVCGPP